MTKVARGRVLWVALAAVSLAALGVLAPMGIVTVKTWLGVGASTETRRDSPTAIAGPAISQPANPFADSPSTRRGWTMGPDGPVLTEAFATHVLKLDPAAREKVDRILQTISVESQALEQSRSKRQVDEAGHVVTTIAADPKGVEVLEDRLWTRLDDVLNPEQQKIARLNLSLHPPAIRSGMAFSEIVAPGFFGWSEDGATVEVWRVGTWYHWRFSTSRFKHADSAPQLPAELQRFWEPPP